MSEPGTKQRICPVCDESVPLDDKSCPSCKTDLTLFQVDGQRVEVGEDVELVGQVDGHMGDLLKAAEGDPFAATTAEPQAEMFECPECNKLIPEDAAACPNCGVEFAEGEVFECPLCQTLVDINTDVCPNCGAEFGDEEVEEAEEAIPEPTPEPTPEPEPVKELSFAERMKAMKGESSEPAAPVVEAKPEPEPAKELSFAERMKAMKEEKAVEAKPEPEAAKPVVTEQPQPKPEVTKPQPEKVVQPQPAKIEEKISPAQKPTPTPTPTPTPQPAPAEASAPSAEMSAQSRANLKEKYKELPKLIGEVKKYLAVAKRCEINVTKSRGLINQAVAAGKNKDLETAVRLVEEGKAGIEKIIMDHMNERVKALKLKANEADAETQGSSAIQMSMASIQNAMSSYDFETVLLEIKKVDSLLKETVGEEALDAKSVLRIMGATMEDAKAMNIEMGTALSFYNEAKKAAENEDWNSASIFAKQAQDSLNEILPTHISTAMKKAKTSLLEIKMMNIDIAKPVEFLKKANIAMKDKNYPEALHSVKEFKDFLDKENYVI